MHREEIVQKFGDIFSFNVTKSIKIDSNSIEITLSEFGDQSFIFTYYNDHSFKLETK